HWRAGDAFGIAKMPAAIVRCREQGIVLFVPSFEAVLAEAEAEAGEVDAALESVGRAVAEMLGGGQRFDESPAHRIRGQILLKQNPAAPAPAEAPFLAAIAVAQQQRARSFELCAALSLAKLYQSTGRPTDAHDVL